MKAWPHQRKGMDDLYAAIDAGHRSICLTCPTGGGKSMMMFEYIKQCCFLEQQTSVYTDRRMLFSQLSDNMLANDIGHSLVSAGSYGHDVIAMSAANYLSDVTLCMVQTAVRRYVGKGSQIHDADSILWDEAHKMGGPTMMELRDLHKPCIDIGFTATPLGIGHVYNKLIVAGCTSELRECGALVLAQHYGPDEPDTRWVGKIDISGGECGISLTKRKEFIQAIFGGVVEHYRDINPEKRPTILFAPGVPESIWFAQQLCEAGIKAAHIDGTDVWLDGESHKKSQELVEDIKERLRTGKLDIVCNRFVLREGIDWPFVSHAIFATIFGSLTSYLQAGGRFLRACPEIGKTHCTIQCHGGNWWRHGSLNQDRTWNLSYDDRIVAGMRESQIREGKEPEPIVCPNPKCKAVRMMGTKCWKCGFEYDKRTRMVVQKDGSLKPMNGRIFKPRRHAERTEDLEKAWTHRVKACAKSSKPSVQRMTFSQLEAAFARDHNWQYPPRDMPMMPVKEVDWFRPVKDVLELTA